MHGSGRYWLQTLVKYEYLTLPNGSMSVAACPDGEQQPDDADAVNGGKNMENAKGSYGMWAMNGSETCVWRFANRPTVTFVDGDTMVKAYPSNTATVEKNKVHEESMKDASECTLLADSGHESSTIQNFKVRRDLDRSGNASDAVARAMPATPTWSSRTDTPSPAAKAT